MRRNVHMCKLCKEDITIGECRTKTEEDATTHIPGKCRQRKAYRKKVSRKTYVHRKTERSCCESGPGEVTLICGGVLKEFLCPIKRQAAWEKIDPAAWGMDTSYPNAWR